MGPASNARPFPATVSRLRAAASVPAAGARALAAGLLRMLARGTLALGPQELAVRGLAEQAAQSPACCLLDAAAAQAMDVLPTPPLTE